MRWIPWRRRHTTLQLDPLPVVGPGDRVVPADTTWGQILDYARGTGETWPLDWFGVGLGGGRGLVAHYAALHRCVTLICGTLAQIVTTPGSLHVVGRDGRRDTGRAAGRAIELLAESPDGESPALHLVEDVASDYALDGNGFLAVRHGRPGGPIRRLERMRAWDRSASVARDGTVVLRLTTEAGASEHLAARDVAHVRWPRVLGGARSGAGADVWATAPVTALRPALDIGTQGDRYVREWFTSGSRARLHIDFPARPGRELNDKQRGELASWIARASRSRYPLVTFGGASSAALQDGPQDRSAAALREYQVREVGRVYGVPAPLLGEQVTEWGRGIEQLARLWWRFAARHHAARLLDPLSRLLLPSGLRLAVEPQEIISGDSDAIRQLVMALQGDAQRPPLATREELRRLAGLPPDDTRTQA